MDSSDSYTSSSSASSQFAVYPEYFNDNRERKSSPPSFHSSLHEIRRVPMKPMKKPIAPLPPTRPKVYKVDCMNFKKVVQRLTAAPEFQPTVDQGSEVLDMVEVVPPGPAFRQQRRLEEVAPPALDLSNTTNTPLRFSGNDQFVNFQGGIPVPQIPPNFSDIITSERKLHKLSETCGAQSPLGFSFSPSSMAWCLSPLLSPGTLSILD
ncbi:OLC1v1011425C1 [Oldenlandia corymbosa var. corymbosa]|uniref:OLC1v1011425C1 n=1 Tax=Oldenlandia corymbosa var. corymbosa TaxID=529605 RepID=A0AAV1DW04_OLDCO|nr:OLC1v1011425C1 [Oldenlandia corymbosa var. corymbosa]